MDSLKEKVFEVIEKVESETSKFYRANKEGYTPHEIRMLLDKFPEVDASDFGAQLSDVTTIKLNNGEPVYIPSDVEKALYTTLMPKP
jgi:hypothetical protein